MPEMATSYLEASSSSAQIFHYKSFHHFHQSSRGSFGQSNDNGRVHTICFPNVFAEPSTCVFPASPLAKTSVTNNQAFTKLFVITGNVKVYSGMILRLFLYYSHVGSFVHNSGDSERVPKTLSCLNQNDESIFSLSPKQSFLLVNVTFEPLIRFHHYYPVRPSSKYNLSK